MASCIGDTNHVSRREQGGDGRQGGGGAGGVVGRVSAGRLHRADQVHRHERRRHRSVVLAPHPAAPAAVRLPRSHRLRQPHRRLHRPAVQRGQRDYMIHGCKKNLLRFFYFGHVFYVFERFFIFKRFLFKKNVGKVQSG